MPTQVWRKKSKTCKMICLRSRSTCGPHFFQAATTAFQFGIFSPFHGLGLSSFRLFPLARSLLQGPVPPSLITRKRILDATDSLRELWFRLAVVLRQQVLCQSVIWEMPIISYLAQVCLPVPNHRTLSSVYKQLETAVDF